MNVVKTDLPGVLVIESRVFGDERGFFMESWNGRRYGEVGLPSSFVQDNLSCSAHGVLRSLHFQNPQPQGKLVSVLQGEVFDVGISAWVLQRLEIGQGQRSPPKTSVSSPSPRLCSRLRRNQPGRSVFLQVHRLLRPTSEGSVLWNDPDIGIKWPIAEPIL
jgi:dTDP-4-dehydrorhamnose 3,5-epimerase